MDFTAIARDGIFGVADATRVGADCNVLRRAERSGSILRLHKGWYAAPPPRDARQLFVAQARARARGHDGRAVVGHEAALLVHGLPVLRGPDEAPPEVQLMFVSGGRHRRRNGVVMTPRVGPPWAVAAGWDTVHPALAVVQAGLSDPRLVTVSGSAALREQLCTDQQLAEAANSMVGCSGIGPARAALTWASALHESPAESLGAHAFGTLGIRVIPQFAIPGSEAYTPSGEPWRADLRVHGRPVLIEIDGMSKYTAPSVLRDEKRREDAIRQMGWEVVRLTWAQLLRPHSIPSLIEAAETRARRRAA